MKKAFTILFAFTLMSMAFTGDQKVHEFKYPKNKDAVVYISSDLFKKFKKKWRGEDYYYLSENGKEGFTCSVLFYKLNEEEKLMYVGLLRAMLGNETPETSPAYPQVYFTNYSNLAKYESNKTKWGDPMADFMFSHSDIREFEGVKVNQKHMYGYAMYGDDLFVNIHLSKVNCSPGDSLAMKEILDGLKKKK